MKLLFKMLLAVAIMVQTELLSETLENIILRIYMNFETGLITDDCIEDIRNVLKYRKIHLLDNAYSSRAKAFIYPKIEEQLIEINISVGDYPENFGASLIYIFNRLVKMGWEVHLKFWLTPKKSPKIFRGCLSCGKEGNFTLEWERGCSKTSADDIIVTIIESNSCIQSFTYKSSSKETFTNPDMLRYVLSALKKQAEWCNLWPLEQTRLPRLRALYLPYHSETETETLIELLKETKLEELNISRWPLAKKEFKELLKYLIGNFYLKKLCITSKYMDGEITKLLGTLVSCNIPLEVLNISFVDEKLTQEAMENFKTSITETNPVLKEIYFGNPDDPELECNDDVIKTLQPLLPNAKIHVRLSKK